MNDSNQNTRKMHQNEYSFLLHSCSNNAHRDFLNIVKMYFSNINFLVEYINKVNEDSELLVYDAHIYNVVMFLF